MRPAFNPWVRKTPSKGHGNPSQYSCLENPMDKGAWWAIQSIRSQRARHNCVQYCAVLSSITWSWPIHWEAFFLFHRFENWVAEMLNNFLKPEPLRASLSSVWLESKPPLPWICNSTRFGNPGQILLLDCFRSFYPANLTRHASCLPLYLIFKNWNWCARKRSRRKFPEAVMQSLSASVSLWALEHRPRVQRSLPAAVLGSASCHFRVRQR